MKSRRIGNCPLPIERLYDLSVEERMNKLKLRPDRADVIPHLIANEAGVKPIMIPNVGLKDDILQEIAEEFLKSSTRYMVEIVHPLVNGFASENLKRMHEYQCLMGEIQDMEVIMQALADAPIHLTLIDPEPVRRYYERCHAEAISAYITVADQLDTIWRPAPDRSFPWEK